VGNPVFVAESGARLPLPSGIAVQEGTPVTYGVRPEHLVLSDTENGFPADIVVVEPTGSETQVVLSLGGQQINGVFRERIADRPDETMYLRPMVESVRLFDQFTGRAIG
jgi:multiple sugar transport system ATP-binding protein